MGQFGTSETKLRHNIVAVLSFSFLIYTNTTVVVLLAQILYTVRTKDI